MDRWIAVACDHVHIESVRTAPEHVLSMNAAIDDVSHAKKLEINDFFICF